MTFTGERMKYKHLITDQVDVFYANLSPEEKKRFLVNDLELLNSWYEGSFYSLRAKFKHVDGIELAAAKQKDFDRLVTLLYTIRQCGQITAPDKLFRLTKLNRKVQRGQVIQWFDPKQPLTSWTDDAISVFRFSPENSMNTTAVSLQVDELWTKYILMDHFLMVEFLEYLKARRVQWIKQAELIPEKQAISLKPRITQMVKDITTQLKGQREYLVYLPKGAKIEVEVTGTLFTAA